MEEEEHGYLNALPHGPSPTCQTIIRRHCKLVPDSAIHVIQSNKQPSLALQCKFESF